MNDNSNTFNLPEPKISKFKKLNKINKTNKTEKKNKFLDHNLDKAFLKNYFTTINLKIK